MLVKHSGMSHEEFQQVLKWACQQGRFLGGHELYGPMLVTKPREQSEPHLNGGGLRGLKEQLFWQAYDRHEGNIIKIAQTLGMQRSSVYAMKRRYEKKHEQQVKNQKARPTTET